MSHNPSHHLWRFIIVTGLIIITFLLRIPAELRVRLEPVNSQQPDFGSKQIIVATDERIFTLFAALNAAGFNREYEGIPMSFLRQQIRAALDGKNIPSLQRLKRYFDKISDYHLVVWVLQRGSAPEFERAEAGWWISTRAANFDGLYSALSDFYKEADIANLWQQIKPQYDATLAYWQPLVETSLGDLQTYLRISELPVRQIVVIPNLLDSYYSGNGPLIGDIAFVVSGPTETELSLQGLIEHETLHSIIGPMLDRNHHIISKTQSHRLFTVLKKSMPSSYGTWPNVLEETIIRAIGLRMIKDESLRNQLLNQLEGEGFLLIRPLYQSLDVYEQSNQSFDEYLPILLDTLNHIHLQ